MALMAIVVCFYRSQQTEAHLSVEIDCERQGNIVADENRLQDVRFEAPESISIPDALVMKVCNQNAGLRLHDRRASFGMMKADRAGRGCMVVVAADDLQIADQVPCRHQPACPAPIIKFLNLHASLKSIVTNGEYAIGNIKFVGTAPFVRIDIAPIPCLEAVDTVPGHDIIAGGELIVRGALLG